MLHGWIRQWHTKRAQSTCCTNAKWNGTQSARNVLAAHKHAKGTRSRNLYEQFDILTQLCVRGIQSTLAFTFRFASMIPCPGLPTRRACLELGVLPAPRTCASALGVVAREWVQIRGGLQQSGEAEGEGAGGEELDVIRVSVDQPRLADLTDRKREE